jgi:Xaa-Pro aminopeptidase
MSPSRLQRLQSLLPAQKVDCLVVFSLPNIRYLSGFTGSNALLVVDTAGATFYTDGRYGNQAQREVRNAALVVPEKRNILSVALTRLGRRNSRYRKVGFETGLSYSAHQTLAEKVGSRLQPVSGVVEKLRMVKDEEEIAAIRAAVELNSRVFAALLPLVKAGATERDLAAEVEYRMRREGAEKPAFETIVASGPNSALPHARPSARAVQANEFVLFDQGAILNGYSSDMTRTVFVGRARPADRDLYATVLEAQQAARQAVRAGVTCGEVDLAARGPIEARQWGKMFTHSTGHGVGLEIHEGPRVARKEKTRLPAGAVITIEPGVYLPERAGVRIEDMVVVRDQGCETLTPTPKDFLEL